MLASLLRPRKGRRRPERSPYASPIAQRADGRNADGYFDRDHPDHGSDGDEDQYDAGGEDDDDHDPVLPIFSAEHLDRLPIYNITHSIRLLVLQRCETTLSWDQLRSPQVSQFLVKPIQQEIRATFFSRGTLYALIANCLNFQKQGEANPGNVGVERTRGLICELLAMRLLKEFSTRELIDALSYDFDPMQGFTPVPATGRDKPMTQSRLARISAVEIAIRAQAKRFLAHPLVVQQLEAIWSGTIVFHSYADSLHRSPAKRSVLRGPNYGTMDNDARSPRKLDEAERVPSALIRRTVTLYDPREASLFKLSRLRVPRYRQLFSTCSFAVMLGLFLAVLAGKSTDITALEVVFWFWSAGYLLEEIVAYTEQGFNLYILSVWNAFDLGILLLFMAYYILRLYGILMPDVRKNHVAGLAYDVLASTAVLLFPRLFSVLDHYRYFSQLLIAFRMMAMDLMAILILIVIACSGFFVAFTLAFGDGLTSAGSAAYALFQLLMGFSPAAWDLWGQYNMLGRAVLVLFLFITHFLIVTILITVLTNSFMAVVQNANEEHQFLFAVNAISMVKSDALFSYIAPTNIIAWLLTPLRYMMPFRSFVKMNRQFIKVTHFPILFAIFSYERLILSRAAFQPEELVERRGRSRTKVPAVFALHGAGDLFSPGTRLREPSITTFHKDRALDEVFRRPFRGPTPTARHPVNAGTDDRRKSSNVVRDWMQGMGHEGGASPPEEEPRSVLDRLEQTKRPGMRRARTSRMLPSRRTQPMARSVASDPDIAPTNVALSHYGRGFGGTSLMSLDEQPQQTDADGDDELLTNDDNEDDRLTLGQSLRDGPHHLDSHKVYETIEESSGGEEYFKTPVAPKSRTPLIPGSVSSTIHIPPSLPKQSSGQERRHHSRNISTNTVFFKPEKNSFGSDHDSNSTSPAKRPSTAHRSGAATPMTKMTPKRPTGSRVNPSPRPNVSQSNLLGIGFGKLPRPPRSNNRDPSFNALALDLASDLGDNRPRPELPGLQGLSASFSTQMEMAAMGARRFPRKKKRRDVASNEDGGDDDDDDDDDDVEEDDEEEDRSRTNRILLARMNTLEESFKEVLKEVRGLRTTTTPPQQPDNNNGGKKGGKGKGKGTKTPVNTGSRTPGASSAGGGSTGTGGTVSTAIHDRAGDVGGDDDHDDDDRSSIRRIEEEEHEGDGDSSRSSI
ncbi:integral membrane channel protein [Diplodia corticola]|uniref:Integral membrane channel protein n=1 Tax=Diplodia corticola TaxID=236234 RepID=A0A1J9R8A0_9PEZI|nr:integral membrane channel protein [Diplodia corticola]OJD36418.1 integral membrane channel protein [Diplodia corticola]